MKGFMLFLILGPQLLLSKEVKVNKVWKVLAVILFPITIALWILNFIIGFILGIFGINWSNILIRLFTGKWPGEYIDEDEFKTFDEF